MRLIRSKLKELSESKHITPTVIGLFAALIIISRIDLGVLFLSVITGLIAYVLAISFLASPSKSIIAYSSFGIFILLRMSDLFPINGWITLIWFVMQFILTYCLIVLVDNFWPRS